MELVVKHVEQLDLISSKQARMLHRSASTSFVLQFAFQERGPREKCTHAKQLRHWFSISK